MDAITASMTTFGVVALLASYLPARRASAVPAATGWGAAPRPKKKQKPVTIPRMMW